MIFFIANIYAQNVFISTPEKLSTELVGFDVVGKNKGGDLLIYKKYRIEDEIVVYDKQMNIKRKKEITIKGEEYESIEVIQLNGELFHFFSSKNSKSVYLKFNRYNNDLEKKGETKIIDSASTRVGDNFSDFKIIKSKNSAFALVYQYELSGGRIDKLLLMVMNDNGEPVQKNTINLPDNNFDPSLVNAAINDFGKPLFLFENELFSCKREKSSVHYYFLFPAMSDQFSTTEIGFAQDSAASCVKEMNFEVNNKTGDITAIGFFGDENKDAMLGYNYFQIAVATGSITQNYTFNYNQQLLNTIAGNSEKLAKIVPVYKITSIIPRQDGGALIAAEFYDKTVENYEFTNYDPYYGYRTSTRQVEYYEYSDVLLISINSQGEMDWNNMIRKRQVSKEDKGINSSFALANCKQNIYFIFNEDIAQNSNVLEYQMGADGTLDRKSLFNPNQQEVELRPAAAKQISFNEIIIPSIYKRNLSFVKVVF